MELPERGGIELSGPDLDRDDLEASFGESALVRYHGTGSQPPLVLVRTWPDEVVKHASLAKALGSHQPIVSVAAPISEDDFPRTVAEWVDRCIGPIRANVDPARTVIGGWSFGGVIALEAAEQLDRSGLAVASVLLIDAALPRKHEQGHAGAVHESARRAVRILDKHPAGPARRRRLRQAARHAPAAWWRWSRRRLAWSRRRLSHARSVAPEFDRTSMSPRKRAIWTAYLKYRNRGSSLPVTILATADSRRSCSDDITLGWYRALDGDVDVRQVDGDHYSMFDADHIGLLARRVASVLEAHRPVVLDRADSQLDR